MNSLGKVLVVFVTACSLGFAAFSMSLVAGGPNWKADAESEELTNEFVFTTTSGEVPMYSVKTRRKDETVGGQTPVLAEAVVNARKRQVDDAKKEEGELATAVAALQPRIKEMKELIPPDENGLVARAMMLDKTLTRISEEIQTVTQNIQAKATAIQQLQRTTEERRDEGYRLKNQLELLRTDLFAALEQQKILEDELVRVEENLKRLERRSEQLQQQVEPYEK